VVCLPGGLMQDSGYLGNLGGLSRRLQLILLDYRGTGHSESPTDPHSYRCDRLVNDLAPRASTWASNGSICLRTARGEPRRAVCGPAPRGHPQACPDHAEHPRRRDHRHQ